MTKATTLRSFYAVTAKAFRATRPDFDTAPGYPYTFEQWEQRRSAWAESVFMLVAEYEVADASFDGDAFILACGSNATRASMGSK